MTRNTRRGTTVPQQVLPADRENQSDAPLWREALILAITYYTILAAFPHIAGVPVVIGIVAGTVLFLLLSLAVIRNIALWDIKPLHEFFLLAFPLTAWYLLTLYATQYRAAAPFISPFGSLLFLIACAFLGRLLSRLIRDVNMLVPIAVVLLIVDIFTVFAGPTGVALDKAPDLVAKLSIGLPAIGSAAGPEGARGFAFIATAGLGDFIFLAFFFAATWRYRLRFERTFWYICILVALAMLASLMVMVLPGIPLLPFVAIGFLLANRGQFSFSAQEKLYFLIAIIFIGVLIAIGILLTQYLK
jgi:hypothetical protein